MIDHDNGMDLEGIGFQQEKMNPHFLKYNRGRDDAYPKRLKFKLDMYNGS